MNFDKNYMSAPAKKINNIFIRINEQEDIDVCMLRYLNMQNNKRINKLKATVKDLREESQKKSENIDIMSLQIKSYENQLNFLQKSRDNMLISHNEYRAAGFKNYENELKNYQRDNQMYQNMITNLEAKIIKLNDYIEIELNNLKINKICESKTSEWNIFSSQVVENINLKKIIAQNKIDHDRKYNEVCKVLDKANISFIQHKIVADNIANSIRYANKDNLSIIKNIDNECPIKKHASNYKKLYDNIEFIDDTLNSKYLFHESYLEQINTINQELKQCHAFIHNFLIDFQSRLVSNTQEDIKTESASKSECKPDNELICITPKIELDNFSKYILSPKVEYNKNLDNNKENIDSNNCSKKRRFRDISNIQTPLKVTERVFLSVKK